MQMACAVLASVAWLACGGNGTVAGEHDASPTSPMTGDASTSPLPPEDCNGAIVLEPTLTVTNAMNGAPICDPVVVIPSEAGVDGGAGVSLSCSGPGCSPDGSSGGMCTFTLVIGGPSTGLRVQVSAPGFEPKAVSNIDTGLQGSCSDQPASASRVALTPLRAHDAG